MTTANNVGKDHDHAVETHPTTYWHSATNPDSDNTEWGALRHDGTNFIIEVGKGNIIFKDSDGNEHEVLSASYGEMYISRSSSEITINAADEWHAVETAIEGLSEDFTYEDHIRRAMKWMVTGRIDRVQAHARAAIVLDPSKPEAYLPLSRILMVQGVAAERIDIMEEALGLVKKAYTLDPQNPEIRNLMCIISEAKSDFDGSEPLCK